MTAGFLQSKVGKTREKKERRKHRRGDQQELAKGTDTDRNGGGQERSVPGPEGSAVCG